MTLEYREHPPHPALADVAACHWSLRGAPAGGGPPYRVLPDGCMDVIFDLGGGVWADRERSRPAVRVVGTMTRGLPVTLPPEVDLLGVRFRPGGALPFLAIPPAEVVDRTVEPPEAGVVGARDTLERLRESGETGQPGLTGDDPIASDGAGDHSRRRQGASPGWFGRPEILDGWLLELRERGNGEPDRAVEAFARLLARDRGRSGPGPLLASLRLSRRQAERRFRAAVGVSPGTACRVERMLHAVDLLESDPATSLSRVAFRAGYADQAHMTRELRRLTGLAPGELRRERRRRPGS